MALSIRDLLERDEVSQSSVRLPEMDPLKEEGALAEAQLVSVMFDAVRSRLGLLFDLRTALAFREGHVGVIIARGVRQFEWEQEGRNTGPTAWNVVRSSSERHNELLLLTLEFSPDGHLILSASHANFYVGMVSSLPSAPPDFTADDEEAMTKGMPSWHSHFRLLQSSRLEAG